MVKLQAKDAVKDVQVLDHKASSGPLTGEPKRGLLDSDYAKSKRDLMALINKFRSTGAALKVHLPTIVVAGNQLSGKSSLIEAVSGINLPRAAGTCTRVPIEVRLRQEVDREWETVVKIRREVNDAGDDNSESYKPEVDFGPVITDPALVNSTIRRAQLAILSPSVPASSFVDYVLPLDEVEKPLGSLKQLSFSRNVIVLEISGPAVTDLPGIIQNVGKREDRGNIGLVEDLVKSYISKDYLILLVLTMKDDIQNQKAALLASEVDPDGRRTIGVLTKVDTLQGRDVDQWVKVLRNEAEPLLHGYHVTRQPNADELAEGISFDTARANELSFFDKTAPWSTLKPKWKERLGTRSLTVSLSKQLLSFIREKLPLLIGHINSRYETIVADLEALGRPSSNDSFSEMMGLVTDFAASTESHIQGGPGHEKLLQDVMAAYMRCKRDMSRTAPRFTPFTAKELDEDEADVQLKMDYAGDVEGVREGPMGSSGQDGKIMNLDDVREHVKRSITRELPNNIPFPAKVTLIKQFTTEWSGLGEGLLAGVRPLLEHRRESVNEQIRMLADNALLQIHKLASLEDHPFTLNDHYLNDLHARFLARLRDKRYPVPASGHKEDHEDQMAQALASLAMVGYTGLKEEDLSKLRPTDGFETELDVMAETRGYWQVAYKRTIDNIPRIIDAEFIVPASRVIRNALINDLSIFAEDGQSRCRKYLAESPVAARQRDELLQRRGRLGHAKEAIRRFGTA